VQWENIGIDVMLASDCFLFIFYTDIALATFCLNKLVGGPICSMVLLPIFLKQLHWQGPGPL
jgi:hypothetical protein